MKTPIPKGWPKIPYTTTEEAFRRAGYEVGSEPFGTKKPPPKGLT